MLKFSICDDNINFLNRLSHILESIFIKYDLKATIDFMTTNPDDLLEHLKENAIDVLILDINLNSNINGLNIAEKVRLINKDCYIIFITAHSEFVFVAYKYKTFDFLCKPINKEVLEHTILRLFEDIKQHTCNKKYIKLNNKDTIIDQNEIQFIESNGMKLIFHTNGSLYETYNSFNKVKSTLPSNFVRCHKSFMVNINNITKVESKSNLIYFKNNTTCRIGPKYKKDFLKEVNFYV